MFLCEGFLQLRRAGATLHRGARASHCCGLTLRSTGSRCAGSVVVAHGPSCSAACGILPDQGSHSCPLHRQADCQPLRHQGSPTFLILKIPVSVTPFLCSSFEQNLTKRNICAHSFQFLSLVRALLSIMPGGQHSHCESRVCHSLKI